MTPLRIATSVRTDGKAARVAIESGGQGIAQLELDATQIDQAIAALAAARDQMQPPFPSDLTLGYEFPVPNRFSWFIPDQSINGRRTLCIMLPGLGWYGLPLSEDSAAKMADLLKKPLADASSAGTVSGTA